MANSLFSSGGQNEEPGGICCVLLSVSRKVPVTGKCLQLPISLTPMSEWFPCAANRQAGRLGEQEGASCGSPHLSQLLLALLGLSSVLPLCLYH